MLPDKDNTGSLSVTTIVTIPIAHNYIMTYRITTAIVIYLYQLVVFYLHFEQLEARMQLLIHHIAPITKVHVNNDNGSRNNPRPYIKIELIIRPTIANYEVYTSYNHMLTR